MLALLLVEFGITLFLARLVLEQGRHQGPADAFGLRGALGVAIAVGVASVVSGSYRPRMLMHTRSLVVATTLAGMLALSVARGVGALSGASPATLCMPDAAWSAQVLLGWVVALLAARLAFRAALHGQLVPHRVALPGSLGDASATLAAIQACQPHRFEVVTPPGQEASPDGMRAAGVHTMLQPTGPPCQARRAAFAAHDIELLPQPVFWERYLGRVDLASLGHAWFAHLDTAPPGRLQRAAARAVGVAASLVLLAFLLPLMGLVAVLVWLDDPGPVLYRQEREGVGGQVFVLLKFRSMRNDAEARGPVWAQRRDPRVTRVGTVLRQSRMDELPQLLNVLRGEMTFIGPRPERPHFVEQLAAVIPFYRERVRVKPGLTGWAQVNFPYGASVEDARAKLSYDLYYIKNRGPMLDLRILLATVRVILFQEGAR